MRRKRAAFIFVLALGLFVAAVLPTGAEAQDGQALIGGLVAADGQPVNDVSVDLFLADADGNRLDYLRSTATGSGSVGDGRFEFAVDPGCYSVTAIAPSDSLFVNGKSWVTSALCLEAEESQTDIDAALLASSPAEISGSTVLEGTDAPVDGIVIDLFEATADGSRGQYLSSAITGADGNPGEYRFTPSSGCFVLIYIAPDNETWAASGSQWFRREFCIESGASTTSEPVALTSSDTTIRVDAIVSRGGVPVDGVVFDVFSAGPNGGRENYLASGRTGSAPVEIEPDGGNCWVVTLAASDGDQFVDSGDEWLNRGFCAEPLVSDYVVSADLIGAIPTTCAEGATFELVMRDDFDGNILGGDWFSFDSTGNSGFGLRRSSAISLDNGILSITAQMVDDTLVSGGFAHRYAQQYGKYRFRVRTDNDESRAMSGVVLTWPESGVHPRDGENNIYETLVQTAERNPFFSFIHEPFGTVHDQVYIPHNADGAQFQTMTMEWTPDQMIIVREGPGGPNLVDTFVIDENDDDLIPDNPHRFTVQLDAWRQSLADPVQMQLDWAEVYKYCD